MSLSNIDGTKNYIIDAIKKIDKMQKEILLDKCSSCVTCETSLITMAYNTIPINLYNCNGIIRFNLTSSTDEYTSLFRVECIREDRFVTLRLLVADGDSINCTDQTATYDLNCVCGIQCFEPINCNTCTQASS